MPRSTRTEFNARIKQLIAYIHGEIQSGSLQLGDYLASEVELGQQFNLSKESVRKALDVLVADGWIVKIRRVGNRVNRTYLIDDNKAPSVHDVNSPNTIPQSTKLSSKQALVLRLAYYPPLQDEGRLQHAISLYEQLNPGIQVELIAAAFPLDFVKHGVADVITLTAWDALKLKEEDPELSLLSMAPETTFANPLLAAPFQSELGLMKAAPFVFSPLVLCYNREHFAQCQIEEPCTGWTWYTLLKAARLLNKQLDVRGFVAHIQSVNRWPVFLLQNGFRFKIGNGQRAAEDPALWESLRISRDLIFQQGGPTLWTESDADVERWFHDEKASIILTTFFGLNRLKNSSMDYGVAPLPALRSDDTLLLVTGLAINRLSPHQEAARSLVRYLCDFDVQTDIRQHTLTLPAHPDSLVLQTGLKGNRPYGESIFSALWERYRLYSDLNLSTAVLEAIREELKSYWSRLEDEAEASERLEVLLNK
jgi:multiple sugar transport system substrate-binding protein